MRPSTLLSLLLRIPSIPSILLIIQTLESNPRISTRFNDKSIALCKSLILNTLIRSLGTNDDGSMD